jgi:hypothetical protein
MSAGYSIPLADARALCDEVLYLLDGTYTRSDYAGSVKRCKAECGDLEVIVAATNHEIDHRINDLVDRGVFSLRYNKRGSKIAYSDRQKALWFNDLPLDVWIVRPDRYWGVTAVLRTGPGELNRMLVGLRGTTTRDGLPGLCPPDLVFRDGAIWRLPSRFEAENYKRNEPLPAGSVRQYTPEEEDVFAVMGLPYLAPEQRHPEVYSLFGNLHFPVLNVPNTTPTICTGRIHDDDPDLLDITVGAIEEGRSTPSGILLAPRREWVNDLKTGRISEERYTDLYYEELRWRWQWFPQGFLNILARERVVLGCYCGHDAFCHRHLCKDILLKLADYYGMVAYDGGELQLQMSLF